jgi:predicted nucleic acid-binding protein
VDGRPAPIATDIETEANVRVATLRLSDRFDLTACDAAYLELAQRRGVPLATADGTLRKAAMAPGVARLGTA